MLTSAPGGFNTAVMGFTTAIGHRRTFEFVFIPIKNAPNPKTNDTMNKLTKLTIVASVWLLIALNGTLMQAATNTFTFNNTTVAGYTGPNTPAGGAVTNISGASLAAGDVVVFDGIIVDFAGANSDSWGSVNLNAGGYLGLTSANLGVLVETASANTSPGQLYLNGGFSSDFAVNQGYTSNRLQIVLTCTETGSTTNMNYQVNIDHGLTGSFNDTLSGSGVTFVGNTIALSFGSQTEPNLFIQNQPVIALAAPTMTPANGILTPGQTATFTANFTAGYPLNISLQWLSNSVPIAGANGLSYTNLPVTASNNGDKYSVIVTNLNNPANVVTSAVDTVTVHSTPGYVTLDFADTYFAGTSTYGGYVINTGDSVLGSQLLAGDTVVFDALVLGSPGGAAGGWFAIDFQGGGYGGLFGTMGVLTALGPSQQNSQIFVNGGSAPNASGSGVLTNRVRVELYASSAGSTTNMGWKVEIDQNDSGTFLPAVTGTNLTFTGNTIPLEFGYQVVDVLATENPQAVSIYSDVSPASQSVPLGGPATVSILAKGWSPAFQWFKNGSLVSGATNRIYTVPSTTLADDGDRFFCVVSNNFNPANVVTSSVATVNIEIPNSLSWYPAVDGTTWDLATANWTTNGGTSQSLFVAGDNVSFDSLGYNLGSTITVTNAVNADAVTLNVSGSQVYSLAGAGTLSGLNLLLTGDGTGGLDLLTSASFATANIAAGTLQVGSSSVNGSFDASSITNNGTIYFNNTSGNLIIDGTLAGSGSIYQEGAGTTTLAATNNIYAISSIDAGTLQIANAPIGNFANNGTLNFSSAINFLFTNAVSGSGAYLLAGYQTNIFTGVSSFTGQNSFLYTIAIVDNPAALGDPVNGSSDITGSLRLGGLFLSNNIAWSQPLSLDTRAAAPSASAYAPHLDNYSGSNTLTSPLTFNNGGGTELNVESDSGLLAVESVLVNNATSTANNLNLQGPGNGEWDGIITDGPGGAGVDSLNVRIRGSGFWALNGVNTYTGNTTVSSGTLCGTGAISGPVTVTTGATIAPGYGGIGTFTINNNLTLGGNVLVRLNKSFSPAQSNDMVNVTGTLSYGGTLTVTNLGSALAAGDSFSLFPAGGTGSVTVSGNAGAGLAFSFSPASGVLSVVTAAAPLSGLKFTAGPVISGTSLTISATNTGAGTVYLLTSTNVAAPISTWTPIWTNVLGGSGSFTTNLLNAVNPAFNQQFYILSNTNN